MRLFGWKPSISGGFTNSIGAITNILMFLHISSTIILTLTHTGTHAASLESISNRKRHRSKTRQIRDTQDRNSSKGRFPLLYYDWTELRFECVIKKVFARMYMCVRICMKVALKTRTFSVTYKYNFCLEVKSNCNHLLQYSIDRRSWFLWSICERLQNYVKPVNSKLTIIIVVE